MDLLFVTSIPPWTWLELYESKHVRRFRRVHGAEGYEKQLDAASFHGQKDGPVLALPRPAWLFTEAGLGL